MNDEEPTDPQAAPATVTRAMELLNQQLGEPTLRSSTRVLILILLSVHKRVSLVELRRFTGLGRSSLGNHLKKLETARYVDVRVIRTFTGKRQMIEIAQKGKDECQKLLEMIRRISV